MIGVLSPGKPYLVKSSRTSSSTNSNSSLSSTLSRLVQKHDDVGHAHLAGQENVFAGLRHGPVRRAHHEDGAIHLRRPGDHVLDVVGVARAIDMRIVPVDGLVFDVADGDGHDLGGDRDGPGFRSPWPLRHS